MKISTRITLVKRVADGFEKLSIGALVLGLFQFNYYAIREFPAVSYSRRQEAR